jgi:hypothetical protein
VTRGRNVSVIVCNGGRLWQAASKPDSPYLPNTKTSGGLTFVDEPWKAWYRQAAQFATAFAQSAFVGGPPATGGGGERRGGRFVGWFVSRQHISARLLTVQTGCPACMSGRSCTP